MRADPAPDSTVKTSPDAVRIRFKMSSKLVHRLLMVAPSHHMTLECTDFNVPLQIEAPR